MADGLGTSGPGAGMFNRLFDAGLNLGVDFSRQELLGQAPGVNQTTRLGLTADQLSTAPASDASGGPFDQKTLLIGLALIVGAVVLAKAM